MGIKKNLWIGVCLATALAAIILSGAKIQSLFWRICDRSTDRIVERQISPDRGEIFDCEGKVIATNEKLYDIYLDCCVVTDQKVWEEKSRKLAQEIAEILPDKTAPEWWDYLQHGRNNKKRYYPIVKDIHFSLVDSLRQLTLLNEGVYKGGIITRIKDTRIYPYGELARRTIGFCRSTDQNSYFGLEAQYEGDLNGDFGIIKEKQGYRRGKVRYWNLDYKKEIDGWDIHTTLDMRHQALADSLLKAAILSNEDIQGGCLMVMEVQTGALKAIANTHRFDNGKIGEYFNYALDYYYEPGSVAQTMTLAAALNDGVVKSLDEKIPTNHGRLYKMPTDNYIRQYEVSARTDSISIKKGFAMSSRYVFSEIAARYAESQDYYYGWLKTFSLDEHNYDIGGVRKVKLPDSNSRTIETLMSTGQGFGFKMSPLHILTFYNTIANDGKMVSPMLINKMKSDKYGTQYMYPDESHGVILRPDVVSSLKHALAFCVSDGTAKALSDSTYNGVAGKTGTSRLVIDPEQRGESIDPYTDDEGRHQYAGTCAAFYPVASPKYTIVCTFFTKPTHNTLYGGQLPTTTVKEFMNGIRKL